MMIPLGQFEITSGKAVVSDPCYERNENTMILGVLNNVSNGTWAAHVHKTEVRDGAKHAPSSLRTTSRLFLLKTRIGKCPSIMMS